MAKATGERSTHPVRGGTGPFILEEGYSTIDADQAVISREPFAAIWLPRDDRTPRVRLVANPHYWDTSRGPHLHEVVFRNDLSPAQALEHVCTTEGEVDIVTEVAPADAAGVETSEHAKLVAIDALRTMAGVIDRDAEGLPFADRRARQALNLAIDRERLVAEAMFGHAEPLAGLTAPAAVTMLHRLSPYPHDPERAAELWHAAGGGRDQTIRIAVAAKLERVARTAAAQLEAALSVDVDVRVYSIEENAEARRRLAERREPRDWDIFLHEQGVQEADGPPFELHRAFVGELGELRAGPVIPEFDALFAKLVETTSKFRQARIAYDIDEFVYEQALALFLCTPHALYAVNRHVDFTPYRTTFELAETRVDGEHWSLR